MKTIILITTVLLSQLCLAGTGGGGVMAVASMSRNNLSGKLPTEIVYNIGNKDGITKFAYGQLVNNEWQVQKVEMAEADLLKDMSVVKALQDSKAINGWVGIR